MALSFFITQNHNPIMEIIKEPTLKSIAYYDYYETQDVIFSHYWLDGNTSSGKKPSDFEVNEDGMYTYNGKVVVATANTNRWNKRPLYNGYESNDHYDTLKINWNGKTYDAIVLDVCGECYGNDRENKQRIDIFMSKEYKHLVHGTVERYRGIKAYE